MLDGRFRFENYVVGSANRLAAAAAKAVAESPGAVYNPLFIYSGSGLGKTHLLAALGHGALALQPELVIEYVTLEDFVDQLHLAISSGQVDAFKRRYQQVDLLLLDDVQFLTGRRETQSEMLRIFNALQGSGRQLVMASDRPPSEITDVDERLLTRLSGGLIVDIGTPDFETRVAILRAKCAERGLTFATGVLDELAAMPFANIRELQGALNRLLAHQNMDDRPLGARDVRGIVNAMRNTPPSYTVAPGLGGPTNGNGSAPAAPRHVLAPHSPIATAAIAPPLGGATAPGTQAPAGGDEFASFLSDVAVAVAQHVDGWRVKLGERIAYWSGAGFRTGVLERALQQAGEVDVDGLEAAFQAAVDRLSALEGEAIAIDPSLASNPVFRDPERVAEAELHVERAYAAREPAPAPKAELTLASFTVNPMNQLAVRAADAVIKDPGRRYNPLFIHGASGVGKTHLLHAVGNALQMRLGGANAVACVSATTFVDELIAALQQGRVERWRERYRAAKALLIDDVDALAGKERSKDELFHLFNSFHEAGKQIVLASTRAPSEIAELEVRLRSRFEGGLVVPIREPSPSAPMTDAFFADPEKVVAEWPSVDGRIIEDLR